MLGASLVDRVDRWRKYSNAMRPNHIANTFLEKGQVPWCKRVSLGHDWNQVDSLRQALHDLNVKRLECVASGGNEVQACMHALVMQLFPLWLLLLSHIRLVLIVNKVHEWCPTVAVVYIVTKPWRVDNRQVHAELLFLKLSTDHVNFHSLVELCRMTLCVVRTRSKLCAEQCIDHCQVRASALCVWENVPTYVSSCQFHSRQQPSR